MTYATKQAFGGQRASLGRVILVKGGITQPPHPMLIDDINGDQDWDEPVIKGTCGTYRFYDAKTEADLATMPDYSWCWPPRLEQPQSKPDDGWRVGLGSGYHPQG